MASSESESLAGGRVGWPKAWIAPLIIKVVEWRSGGLSGDRTLLYPIVQGLDIVISHSLLMRCPLPWCWLEMVLERWDDGFPGPWTIPDEMMASLDHGQSQMRWWLPWTMDYLRWVDVRFCKVTLFCSERLCDRKIFLSEKYLCIKPVRVENICKKLQEFSKSNLFDYPLLNSMSIYALNKSSLSDKCIWFDWELYLLEE